MKMNVNKGESIFVEKYRPQTVDDIILPESLKQKVTSWIQEDEIPNLLLVSKQPGTGKSSLAHVLIKETNADALFINISLNGNIDTLRGKIQGFVSTVGFEDKHKIVVLDEFDGASTMLQKALRGFTEEFSKSARFILTANYKEKIIEPLQNRLQVIDFDQIFADKNNKQELVKQTYLRLKNILDHEGISYTKEQLMLLIKSFYPSTRAMIMKIQENLNTETNELELDESKINKSEDIDQIIEYIKNKQYTEYLNSLKLLPTPDILFTELYNRIEDFDITKRPQITILIAKYSYQDAFARDRELNIAALGAEIMSIL
jgi:replication factor C small subunit